MAVTVNDRGQFTAGNREPVETDQGKPPGASTSGGGMRGVGNFAEKAEELRGGVGAEGKGFGFKPNPIYLPNYIFTPMKNVYFRMHPTLIN